MKRIIVFSLLLIQCSTAVEYPIPLLKDVVQYEANTTIQAVWERTQQSPTGFFYFDQNEDSLWLSGYISSSDASGNFYKELYIQDKQEQPTRAIRLLLDQTALYSLYPMGMKIFVLLNGLGVGHEKGVLSLGSYEADGVSALPLPLIDTHIRRTEEIVALQPVNYSPSDLTNESLGQYIQLNGIQFAASELGKTYSAEAFDQFEGERRLVSCADFSALILSSSRYSKFKSIVIDSSSGSIKGIHTRDYYNEKDIFKINHPSAINFAAPRCDPFYEESFESYPKGRFEGGNWINWIEKGTVYWEVYEAVNSLGQSLRIGSYRSGDKHSVCWLVSPQIELHSLTLPTLSFRTSTAFADSSKLELLYSTDFEGTPTQIKKATWTALKARIATKEDNDQIWIDSEALPINFKSEKIHIAFRYTGSGKTENDGTFELDDIRIYDLGN